MCVLSYTDDDDDDEVYYIGRGDEAKVKAYLIER
jgi:hypothetical protein